MYDILIADDEELIRRGMAAKIEGHDPRMGQILFASDGREALRIIREKRPSILITDIRMPDVDGLSLIRQTKEIMPELKLIIVSGFAEFDYAEQALEFGVSNYLLKPVSEAKLNEALGRSMNELDRRQWDNHLQTTREQQFWSLQLEQAVNQMIHGDEPEDSARAHVRELWETTDGNYLLALLNIDGKTYFQSSFPEDHLELLKYAIGNIVYECFAKWGVNISGSQVGKYLILNDSRDRKQLLLLLFHPSKEAFRYEPEVLLNQVRNLLAAHLSVSLTIGMSEPSSRLGAELYRQAVAAVQERLSHGSGKLYRYRNTSGSVALPERELGLLEKYMERYDISSIRGILDSIFQEQYVQGQPVEYARRVWLQIVNILVHLEAQFGHDAPAKPIISLLDPSVLDKLDDLGGVRDYFCEIITDFLEKCPVEPVDASGKVDRALRYIEQHYDEDLSINDLASLNGQMTPSYFSTLFKRETGKTVVSFITEKRLQQACRLLLETSGSVIDIANQVGYHDVQYFFRVFKKAVGKTPLEYRKKRWPSQEDS